MNQRITFVGGGNMATSLINGLLQDGWSRQQIQVLEPDSQQRQRIAERVGVDVRAQVDESLSAATVVLWAVKPQVMREAVAATAPFVRHALHISIAAGVQLSALTEWLGTNRVVRSMPNLAAVVRAAVTGVCAGAGVSESDREVASRILSAAGHVFWVNSEDDMDAVNAVSGSGPGYVFHFLEGFQDAAEQMGFSPARARELVLLVTEGAVRVAQQDATSLRILRERVSSKGGTTVAGTNALDRAGTQAALVEAVKAAHARARELGGNRS